VTFSELERMHFVPAKMGNLLWLWFQLHPNLAGCTGRFRGFRSEGSFKKSILTLKTNVKWNHFLC